MQANFGQMLGGFGQAFLSGVANAGRDQNNSQESPQNFAQVMERAGQAFVTSLENSSQNASAGSAAQTPPGPDFAQFFQNVAQTTLQNSSEQGTASLEQLFQGFGQAFEGLVETIDQGNGVPPTSASALETLPKIKITAQDLEESQNCHCTVCIEDFVLGEEALRLPCGHLFHEHCIKTWLQKHSQCPVCRYELPTDNVSYEQGRQARMSERRPRMR